MASEIRVDNITSLSGVGTITPSATGVEIAGITTVSTLKATTGIVTSLTAGSLTSLGDVDIADKIIHTGDTNTAIRFPSADTVTVETAGSERLSINSSGVKGIKNGNLNIQSTYIDFSGDISTPTTAAAIFRPADNTLSFSTANAERLRITSAGKVGIGTTNPQGTFQIESTDPNFYITNQLGNSNPVNSGTIHFREAPATASFFITHNGSTNKLVIGGVNGSDTFSHITLPRASANIEAGANIVIPSGNGIDFSATANSNAGMTSELFDDYEEGVYTATSTNATWNTSQNLISYTKIGRLVTITAQILQLGGSGNLDVNLPFAAASGSKTEFAAAGGVATYDQNHTESSASDGVFGLINNAGTTLMLLQTRDNNDWIHLQCDAAAYLRFFITYVAA